MTLMGLNNDWFYQGAVSEENKKKIVDTFSVFIKDDNNFNVNDNWDCDVLTTYNSSTLFKDMWKVFGDCVQPNLLEFIEQCGPKGIIDINVKNGWVNRYRKGDHQESHEHSSVDCNIALVYFYNVKDSSFNFMNPSYSNYSSSGLLDCFNIPNHKVFTPEIKNGDIILFPSHHIHMVSPNKFDEERVTISCNLNFKKQEN